MPEDEDEITPALLIQPEDLYELYLGTRAELSSSPSFYRLYLKLMFLIDVGKEMLPNTKIDVNLRREAEELLSNISSYPEPRQMEYVDGGRYRMGTGSDTTGLVEVRSDDLEIALKEVKNQQATAIIPKLKNMDSKIFKRLIEVGIIEVKKASTEELLMQDVIMSINKKARELNEEEERDD